MTAHDALPRSAPGNDADGGADGGANRSARKSRRGFAVLCVLLAGLGAGCQPGSPFPPPDGGADCSAPVVAVRVRNASGTGFDTLQVGFPGGTVDYGALAAGATSGYAEVAGAYRYAYVEAFSRGRRHVVQPIDYVGESVLPTGRYTYVLSAPRPGGAGDVFMGLALKVDARGTIGEGARPCATSCC